MDLRWKPPLMFALGDDDAWVTDGINNEFEGEIDGSYINDLHSDLASKYAKHGAKVESFWRSFDMAQRTECIKRPVWEGKVLKHRLDASLGDVCKLTPEWNLRELADPESDRLLSLMRRRATTPLMEQFSGGPDGTPGDAAFIEYMMKRKNLRREENGWTIIFFGVGKLYGKRHTILEATPEERLQHMVPLMLSCKGMVSSVMEGHGELIMKRQMYLLACLNLTMETILELGSQTRDKKQKPGEPVQAATAALSKLRIAAPPAEVTLPDLVATSLDQKDALEEYLGLLTTEPVVLSSAVRTRFMSHPELVADERGRRISVLTDKYISPAFFEVIHDAVKAAAIWNYIARLLELLGRSPPDKVHRVIILQELSNMDRLEYGRAQAAFKRQVQMGSGNRYFRRTYNAVDKTGNARVTIKGKPEDHTRSNPQLHYMLRLCQPGTDAPNAMEWVKKLSDLHEAHPSERERVSDREIDAFSDLVVVASFIQDLSSAISLPSPSRKNDQAFVSRSQRLEADLGKLKGKVDLGEFVAPIDNLLEPGEATLALKALDSFVAENASAKLGLLHYDVVDDSIADVDERCRQAKAKREQEKRDVAAAPAFPSTPEPATKVETPAKKQKTRSPGAAAYDIVPPAEPAPEGPAPSQTFYVSASTAEVFTTLFDRSQSHGSVAWTAFEGAMAELGFSVVPCFGSVYTFFPPGAAAVKRPFTVHRPHGAWIEGYRVLVFARRLARVYGWGQETFRVK